MEKELTIEKKRTSELSDEELLIKAKEELGETDNIREESLILIKEWIKTQIGDYSNLGNIEMCSSVIFVVWFSIFNYLFSKFSI